jgi:hypothetical protein
VGSVKIPYYVVKKGLYGYWQPTRAMREAGFAPVRCGRDGPAAWAIAQQWNERWQLHRTGNARQALPAFPAGSIGEGFERYRLTDEWREKKPRTREDWERGWARIRPVFGDVPPGSAEVNLEALSAFRGIVRDQVSPREAHRVIKIWRALWNVLAALGYTRGKQDPSLGIRNRAPAARQHRWSEGEAVRLTLKAWKVGYRGLAVAIAIAWDTQFSPVDLRQLTMARLKGDGPERYFDIGRAKSGRDAYGTLSRRTLRLLDAYLALEPCDVGALLRNRSGAAYSRFTLPDDFRALAEMLFPGDKRTLADMRRSGALELLAGDAAPGTVSAKMANTISTSNALQKAYQPVDLAAVRSADKARLVGRARMRATKT